jgi:hypothetical protein
MKAVGTSVPELDQVGVEPVAAPALGAPQRLSALLQRIGYPPGALWVVQLLTLVGDDGGRLKK